MDFRSERKEVAPLPSKGDMEALVEAMRELPRVQPLKLEAGSAGECSVLAVPEGWSIFQVKEYLDEYLEQPERHKGCAHLHDLASFAAYVHRYGDPDTTLVFADQNAWRLTAVLDYHEARAEDGRGMPSPGWQQWTARYGFPVSDELQAWTLERRDLDQETFASFLEERAVDVLAPDSVGEKTRAPIEDLGLTVATPQKLVELSRGLDVHVTSKVGAHKNLSSGEGEIFFTEEHQDAAGKKLSIPAAFFVGVPVFRGGARYPIPVRIRYRVKGGAVRWSLLPHQPDRILRHAFEESVEQARQQLEPFAVVSGAA